MNEVLALLVLLTVIAAVVTVMTPRLLHAVISLGAVGFLLAIVFVFLAAPDIAIVQIGVEVVTIVILIRATMGRDKDQAPVERPPMAIAVTVGLVAVMGLFGLQVISQFPELGAPVMERFADAPSSTYLRDGLAETGGPNIVTAVLLDFRLWDTLGEATVLFGAVLGTVALMRRKARVSNDQKVEGGGEDAEEGGTDS